MVPSSDSTLRWYCFHTGARREKKVAEQCRRLGVRHYLPLRRNVKHYEKSTHEHLVPCFPNYVFGCLSEEKCYDLGRSGHVVNVLRVYDEETLVRDLKEIQRALEVSDELETAPGLEEGQRVRICSGPFRGVEGVVAEQRRDFRVALNVHFINRSMLIEVDASEVDPI
ncbi:MAG: transcription termination/antitermination protein NusG [Candidatus Brocadiia bacterium]